VSRASAALVDARNGPHYLNGKTKHLLSTSIQVLLGVSFLPRGCLAGAVCRVSGGEQAGDPQRSGNSAPLRAGWLYPSSSFGDTLRVSQILRMRVRFGSTSARS